MEDPASPIVVSIEDPDLPIMLASTEDETPLADSIVAFLGKESTKSEYVSLIQSTSFLAVKKQY
jgi:hypothetical protein